MIKSLRIKTISELIDKSMVVADIGCDHAYLSILLKEKGLKSVAIDNKETVIGIALKNIKKHNDKDYVEVILSDGLEFLPNYVNTLVISGMGGKNIIDILKKGDLSNIDNLILLPHKDLFILRQSLQEIGFKIANEYLVFENWAINNGYEEGLTIDRLDNSKGYSPQNCRWVDAKTQGQNKRNNRSSKASERILFKLT